MNRGGAAPVRVWGHAMAPTWDTPAAPSALEVLDSRPPHLTSGTGLDPTTHTEYGHERAHALGLEGWVETRGETVAEFACGDVFAAADDLQALVERLRGRYGFTTKEIIALSDAATLVSGMARIVAARTYLQGFRDGRVMRLASEVVQR